MGIICWGFTVDSLPAPPTGINQASPPPAPEVLATKPATLADVSNQDAFASWLLSVARSDPWLVVAITVAVENGLLNVACDPWPQALAVDPNLPRKTVSLQAIASWQQIYSAYNMSGSSHYTQQVTMGVTNTDEQTRTFGVSVGLSATAGYGAFSATLTTNFSYQSSTAHSISVTKESLTNAAFDLSANSFIQIWQLQMQISASNDGASLTQMVPSFQTLTYPPPLREELEARAKAEVEKLTTRLTAKR